MWTKPQKFGSYSNIAEQVSAVFGSHVASALAMARTHAFPEQVMVFTDRDLIARDLHDVVNQRLLATGLSMQSLQRSITYKMASERMRNVTMELDETIRDLRNTIVASQLQ